MTKKARNTDSNPKKICCPVFDSCFDFCSDFLHWSFVDFYSDQNQNSSISHQNRFKSYE